LRTSMTRMNIMGESRSLCRKPRRCSMHWPGWPLRRILVEAEESRRAIQSRHWVPNPQAWSAQGGTPNLPCRRPWIYLVWVATLVPLLQKLAALCKYLWVSVVFESYITIFQSRLLLMTRKIEYRTQIFGKENVSQIYQQYLKLKVNPKFKLTFSIR
jgi:hypothetical protein